MKRPSFVIPLDIHIVNNNHDANNNSTSDNSCDVENHGKTTIMADQNDFSIGDTTYRHDGVTIGRDYLRLEGQTITRGKLHATSLVLEETIGQGAFNKVHRAVWETNESSHNINNQETKTSTTATSSSKSQQNVAIKQYPLIIGSTTQQKRQMLIQELRSLCHLDNPCLVQFHGAFLNSETVTIVLEYMDQNSLEHALRKRNYKGFSSSIVASMSYQLLHGLSYLHNHKPHRILHRDIKTENCLVNSQGCVKLCDFGIASITEAMIETTNEASFQHKTVIGTTLFMAPERLRAQPYGRSSDVWSLGLVVLQLVTGQAPWDSVNSIVELLVTVEEMTTNQLIPKETESGLREILTSCLQLSPTKRMPAKLLLQSPWFYSNHGIASPKDASTNLYREMMTSALQEMSSNVL